MRTDVELLRDWRAGNHAAGRALVDRYFAGVHRMFRARLPADVDDLTQRTFLAVLAGSDAIRSTESLRAYVFPVARNQLCRALKQRYATQRDAGVPTEFDSPSHVAAARQDDRLLIRALRQLAVDDQIALQLRYWEELSVADVAAVLGVSSTAAKSRLLRARQRALALMASEAAAGAARHSTQDDYEAWSRRTQARIEGSLTPRAATPSAL